MTGVPCPHLEAELPNMQQGFNSQYMTYIPGDLLDLFEDTEDRRVKPYFATIKDVSGFIKKLENFGLNRLEIDVVVGRVIYDKTYAELAKDWGTKVDPKDVYRVFMTAKSTIEGKLKNGKK